MNDLSKSFGGTVVLDGLDLEVESGTVFGFLGPNGAGKSTTINVLLGLRSPTSGTARVLGYDVETHRNEIHQRVGVLPEGVTPFPNLTGTEHVEFVARTRGVAVDPIERLSHVGLDSEAHDRPASEYSTGMQQRLWLAMALVGDPELVVLDEPTSGLDPDGIREIRQLVTELRNDGTSVFLSSHRLEEVETMCDRVGILHDGQIERTVSVADGSLGALSLSVGFRVLNRPEALSAVLAPQDGVQSVEIDGQWVTVTCETAGDRITAVETALNEVEVEDLSTDGASLDALFDRTVHGGES
ncbi:ABC transporter ATP-binding protein [Halobaculum sp. MBLA0143]|uniref:ABC transporter ATP-binding protein n=1 Tax=Halobaculum sp. MBLA0143 TaxID=3079933 RepID=UPI0035254E0E